MSFEVAQIHPQKCMDVYTIYIYIRVQMAKYVSVKINYPYKSYHLEMHIDAPLQLIAVQWIEDENKDLEEQIR